LVDIRAAYEESDGAFQGPEFYPKFGYREFGRLAYPPGQQRILLQKPLTRE
jgi:hypothetical protein